MLGIIRRSMSAPHNKIHVLLVTTGYPPEHSGSGNRIHHLYCRLKEAYHELAWTVLTKRRDKKLIKDKKFNTISVYSLLNRREGRIYQKIGILIREILWIRHLVKSGIFRGIDLVHCTGWSWLTFELCRYARKRNIPIIRELTSGGDGGLSPGFGGRMIRKTNEFADLLVAISPSLKQKIRKSGLDKKVWCRPNPVDIFRFHHPTSKKREESRLLLTKWLPKLSRNDLVILQIGRMRPLKNQLFLCEVVSLLPDRFHLVIVGPAFSEDQSYVEQIRNRISIHDLARRVHLEVGLYKGVESLMQGADIYAFPSKDEGLGNVMIEALSTGLPVVATHLPGVTDWIIEPQKNGALCQLTPESFKKGILLVEPLVTQRPQIADDAASQFDSSIIDQSYWEHISRLINKSHKH